MQLRSLFCFLLLSNAALWGMAVAREIPPVEKLSLDHAWKFHEGDIPFPKIIGHEPSYFNAKAGKAWGAAAQEFDDSQWRVLDLPHDWAVEQPFNPQANLSQGYRDRGIGWYRRSFRLEPSDRGKALELQFEGISTYCQVWLNGTLVHRNWCGYTGFTIDLTPFALYGDQSNHIAIRVDAEAMEGWWYEGAGIYRHTWLVKRNPLHIETDGVFAQPVRREDGGWEIPAEVSLSNIGHQTATGEVLVTLTDPEGKTIGTAGGNAEVGPLGTAVVKTTLKVKEPRLWSVDSPVLYKVRTALLSDGVIRDQVETRCGFRTIRFDARQGFFLNDKPLKLKGTCNHQDHAGVGVAVPAALWDFRIRRLKEMGSNAYRCSHNPPAREFLDACDRLGMLVMDENRNFNVSPETMRQLEWLIRRDRNHPSVFMWSIFNEETTQGTEMGYEMVRRMSAVVKRLDSTRPVTAAMSGGHTTPVNVSQAVDVVGFNYSQHVYDDFHRAHPDLPSTSSEDTSAFMIRGNYVTDKSKNLIDSYDTQRASWGLTHRDAWRRIAERPFLAGAFVWTGFDYRGEPSPLQWPSAGSFFGIVDQCGFPKSAFHLHQAHWIADKPVLKIIPHWNWQGQEGRDIKVMVLTNAENVELSLNGKSLGEKKVDPIDMVEWQVPYSPGKLEATARKGGKEWARTTVETTGGPVALVLTPDRKSMAGDGLDAMPVTVHAVDAKGLEVPTANLMVDFETSGPGKIIGVGNGDPNCHEVEKILSDTRHPSAEGWKRSLFNGLAQVIVQSNREGAGGFTLTARAPGLRSASTVVEVLKAEAGPFVPVDENGVLIGAWRQSPLSKERPDPNQKTSDNDMNSWVNIQPGTAQDFGSGGFAVLRTVFTPPADIAGKGGVITFREITGRAEVLVDGVVAATKTDPAPGPLKVPFAGKPGPLQVSVLVEAAANKAGLTGLVSVAP